MLTAHRWHDADSVRALLLGFTAFCLTSSALYLVNDYMDREADRLHPTKKKRPFASGELAPWTMFPAVTALTGVAAFIAYGLPIHFALFLVAYAVLTLVYSFWIKRLVLLDVIVLAALFTVRLFAGAALISVLVSPWLRAFSMFIFVSLAFAKRYAELYDLRAARGEKALGRGYHAADLEMIGVIGPVCGIASVLIAALYLNSEAVQALYQRPDQLWMTCVLLLYWISRVWLLAHRGDLHQDPVVFALKDPPSYVVGILTIIILISAI